MTSGYRVTATFFVPADPNDMRSLEQAHDRITDVIVSIEKIDPAMTMDKRYLQRRKQSPAALAAEQVEERAAQETLDAHPGFGDKRPADEMPPIPPNPDRRRA